MHYPFLSPRGQAIAGRGAARWDVAYQIGGELPDLVIDHGANVYAETDDLPVLVINHETSTYAEAA